MFAIHHEMRILMDNRPKPRDQRPKPGDQPGKGQSTGEVPKLRRVKDFDRLARQQGDQAPESSGTASNIFETVDNPLLDNKMRKMAEKGNKEIASCHTKYGKDHTAHLEKSKKEIQRFAKRLIPFP
jgi:hypothetical protein